MEFSGEERNKGSNPEEQDSRYIVKGIIRNSDGAPMKGLTVRAYDRNLSGDIEIGMTLTGEQGEYLISYSYGNDSPNDKEMPDIYINVYNAQNNEEYDSSRVIYNAGRNEILNHTLKGNGFKSASEYSRLQHKLNPYIKKLAASASKRKVNKNEVEFLSGKTNSDNSHIESWISSYVPAKGSKLTQEIFYGLRRQNVELEKKELLSYKMKNLYDALDESVNQNVIAIGKDEVSSAKAGLKQYVLDKIYDESQSSTGTMSALIASVIRDKEKQQLFWDAYIDHNGTDKNFVQNRIWLKHEELSGHSDDLGFTLGFAAILGEEFSPAKTLNNSQLVNIINEKKKSGEITKLSDIARFDEKFWGSVLEDEKGDNENTKIGFTARKEIKNKNPKAREISRKIEEVFPTEFAANRIIETGKKGMRTFFSRYLNDEFSFNIENTHIDTFVRDNPSALKGIRNREGFIKELKSLQRVRKFSESFEMSEKLLKGGIHSALQVSRMGQNSFVEKYGAMDEEEAVKVHNRAKQASALALNLLADMHPSFNLFTARALSSNNRLPDIEHLFGSFDLCDVKHCQSVLGPSAYLVDVLHYLSYRKSKEVNLSAKDILFKRRQDIGEIELSCQNTNTELPYIDLVNEILENAVIPPGFSISIDNSKDLDGGIVTEALVRAFNTNGYHLTPNIEIKTDQKANKKKVWRISDKEWMYLIKIDYSTSNNNGSIKNPYLSITPYPQTGGSSNELSVNPEHLNEKVYNVLKDKYYPWSLPFDLWHYETGLWLENMGVPRHDLMKCFMSKKLPSAMTDMAIAAEYLGMTAFDIEMITRRPVKGDEPVIYPLPGPEQLWGFKEVDTVADPADDQKTINDFWYRLLQHVRIFLDRSGLSYKEMMDLFKTRFINYEGIINVESNDGSDPASCDTAKLVIKGITAWDFTKIHSFVRLWRKLGWPMFELDRVLCAALKIRVSYENNSENPFIDLAARCMSILSMKPDFTDAYSKTENSVIAFIRQSGMETDIDGAGIIKICSSTNKNYRKMPELLGIIRRFKQRLTKIIEAELFNNYHYQLLHDELINFEEIIINQILPLSEGYIKKVEELAVLSAKHLGTQKADNEYYLNYGFFVQLGRLINDVCLSTKKCMVLNNSLYYILYEFSNFTAGYRGIIWNLIAVYIDHNCIRTIYNIQKAQKTFGMPISNLLAWYCGMDTTDYNSYDEKQYPSLYSSLFMNKSVMKLYSSDEYPFELNQSRTDVWESGRKISNQEVMDGLCAALRVKYDDLELVIKGKDNVGPIIRSDELSIRNITLVYVITSISKAVKIPISELVKLLSFCTIDEDISQIKELLGKIRSFGFTIDELDYLFRHRLSETSDIVPSSDTVTALLEGLNSDLQKMSGMDIDNKNISEDKIKIVLEPLIPAETMNLLISGLKWNEKQFDTLLSSFDSVSFRADLPVFPQELDDLLKLIERFSYDKSNAKLKFRGVMTSDQFDRLLYLTYNIDTYFNEYKDALTKLYNDSQTKASDAVSTADLAVLPEKVAAAMRAVKKVSYDDISKEMIFTGAMNLNEKYFLNSVLPDYSNDFFVLFNAVCKLFDEPRLYIARNMKEYGIPVFKAESSELTGYSRISDSLKHRVYFEDGILYFGGIMTPQDKNLLSYASSENKYINALQTLYDEPRRLIEEGTKTFKGKTIAAKLDTMPTGTTIPECLKDRLVYDSAEGMLYFTGGMGEDTRKQILNLPPDKTEEVYKHFETAVERLSTPEGKERFLAAADIKHIFDGSMSIEECYAYIGQKYSETILADTGVKLIVKKLADFFKMDENLMSKLVTSWLEFPGDNTRKIIDAFLEKDFIMNRPPVKISPSLFPNPYKAFYLLHKVSLLATRLNITGTQMSWLFDKVIINGKEVLRWLDLNLLPLEPVNSYNADRRLFAGFEKLLDLFEIRDNINSGEKFFEILFSCQKTPDAGETKLVKEIARFTEWSENEINILIGNKGLELTFPDDYLDGRAMKYLWSGFDIMTRFGLSASQCLQWSKHNMTRSCMLDINDASNAKKALKARYPENMWLETAKPVVDKIRQKKRDALITYHLINPPEGEVWKDTNDLYGYFLIDVEMSPLMPTSRIKQAMASVQLFVQRCFMSLEKDVSTDKNKDDAWQQWEWMKNYRVWEANRKIFLYPENWIEPDLRDNKSQAFKELEDELLQNEITDDTAETAFIHYLEKLDAVSHLQICEMFVDEDNAYHVFGRTFGDPRIYYYRKREKSGYWTAWEKVDAPIEGDHLIPVIINRRLYVFWPVFTEKTYDRKIYDTTVKYWEIRIAWSEYRNGRWTAKKVSSDKMTSLDLKEADGWVPGELLFNNTYPLDNYGFRLTNAGDSILIQISQLGMAFKLNSCREGDIEVVTSSYYGDTGWSYDDVLENSTSIFRVISPPQYKFYIRPYSTMENYMAYQQMSRDIDNPNYNLKLMLPTLRYYGSKMNLPFYFQDKDKTYLVKLDTTSMQYRFDIFYHPYAVNYMRQLAEGGISKLLTLENQQLEGFLFNWNYIPGSDNAKLRNFIDKYYFNLISDIHFSKSQDNKTITVNTSWPKVIMTLDEAKSVIQVVLKRSEEEILSTYYLAVRNVNGAINVYDNFFVNYCPTAFVKKPYPFENVDFTYGNPYSIYNWELFFHIPLLIADSLSKNQQFEKALKWFHYIFNPTDTSEGGDPNHYWRVRPFFEKAKPEYIREQIDTLMRIMAQGKKGIPLSPEDQNYLNTLSVQVEKWRMDPFKPHMIAQLRTTAYQKTVVAKYLDNLINWGDYLFRQERSESVNEALQLYMLAAMILGRRPELIKPNYYRAIKTYDHLENDLDDFSNALVDAENIVPTAPIYGWGYPIEDKHITLPSAILYFGIPKNDKLWSYWDTVADRLFKIRNCLNIDGTALKMPLFDPPIDPALLVKAAASGIGYGDVLSDMNAPMPYYRFTTMLQKALELCGEVRSMGSLLLAALEKNDAEALSILQTGHEKEMLRKMEEIKKKQVTEADETIESLNKSLDVIQTKIQYYQGLQYMNTWETASRSLMAASLIPQGVGLGLDIAAGISYLIPQMEGGAAGVSTPHAVTQSGGVNIGGSLSSFAGASKDIAGMLNTIASMESATGSYKRRWEEWKFQEKVGGKEKEQLSKQIDIANIRKSIADKELANHCIQIENADEVYEYLKNKFTNKELYNWMVGQITNVYFQSYKLAYDMAKRAERSFIYELGGDSKFISFGYWDSLRKGLLSGDKLYNDIKRMEIAYYEQNKRDYEITKHISLAVHDPMALIKLKENGECFVTLQEWLYDFDFPGHYNRRIKSASLSIPCITGPYTSVNCRLTLVSNSIRISTADPSNYARSEDDTGDIRFADNICSIQSIVTSSGREDSGLFELSLHDERYLPFEGAGAISTWKIELDKECNQFNIDSVSDVILHIRYKAKEGGEVLKKAAKKALADLMEDTSSSMFARMISIKQEFCGDWSKFIQAPENVNGTVLGFKLTNKYFQQRFRDKIINLEKMNILIKVKDPDNFRKLKNPVVLSLDPEDFKKAVPVETVIETININNSPAMTSMPQGEAVEFVTPISGESSLDYLLKIDDRIKKLIEDIYIVVFFRPE